MKPHRGEENGEQHTLRAEKRDPERMPAARPNSRRPSRLQKRRRHERGQKHGPHAEKSATWLNITFCTSAAPMRYSAYKTPAPGLQPELVQLHIGKLKLILFRFHSMTSKSAMMKTCDSTEKIDRRA